jgi:hypothetical protein
MNDVEMQLCRQNANLQEDKEKLENLLNESRIALLNSQATVHALSELCLDLVDKAKNKKIDEDALVSIASDVEKVNDPEWLIPIYNEAMERGVNAGYIFARTTGRKIEGLTDVVSEMRKKTASIWKNKKSQLSPLLREMRVPEPCRFRFNPEDKESPFDFSDNGEYVSYDDYVSLKFSHDLLKEEIAGYRHIVRDPLCKDVKVNSRAAGRRKFVRRPRKEGIIKAQFGENKGEQDFFVLYGDGVPSCDRALIFHAFGAKTMSYDYSEQKPRFEPSLLTELEQRGYDLSTFNFSVCKKK